MSDKKAVIKNADMSDEMQQDAVDCAMQAMEKYNIEKDIAAYVKKEFDKKYNPTWHCIVGRNFGSYVTHETKHFIYFYLDMLPSWFPACFSQLLFAFSNTSTESGWCLSGLAMCPSWKM
uniref:Dynein light chain n=1 Tax=Labrus bergylta TaxID=56723 RepID=A0A3Q3FLM9_9LABR